MENGGCELKITHTHSQGVSLPNSYLRMDVADKWEGQEM